MPERGRSPGASTRTRSPRSTTESPVTHVRFPTPPPPNEAKGSLKPWELSHGNFEEYCWYKNQARLLWLNLVATYFALRLLKKCDELGKLIAYRVTLPIAVLARQSPIPELSNMLHEHLTPWSINALKQCQTPGFIKCHVWRPYLSQMTVQEFLFFSFYMDNVLLSFEFTAGYHEWLNKQDTKFTKLREITTKNNISEMCQIIVDLRSHNTGLFKKLTPSEVDWSQLTPEHVAELYGYHRDVIHCRIVPNNEVLWVRDGMEMPGYKSVEHLEVALKESLDASDSSGYTPKELVAVATDLLLGNHFFDRTLKAEPEYSKVEVWERIILLGIATKAGRSLCDKMYPSTYTTTLSNRCPLEDKATSEVEANLRSGIRQNLSRRQRKRYMAATRLVR